MAKSTMAGIRMCTAIAPTALPRDHAVERLHIEPTWRYPKRTRPDDTPEQRDLPLPRNRSPPFFHLLGRCNQQMGARTSTTHCARGIGIDVLFASCRIHQSRIAYVNTPAPPPPRPKEGQEPSFFPPFPSAGTSTLFSIPQLFV